MRPTTIAACAAIALCAATYGCGSTPVAEASGSRFSVEYGGPDKGLNTWELTDTETGRQWVVVSGSAGMAMQPLSPYVQVGPSNDWGE